MTKKHRILLAIGCGLITALAGWATDINGGYTVLAPCNILLLLPALLYAEYVGSSGADMVAIILPPLVFWAWCWPIFRQPSKVPVRSIVLLGLAIVLSAYSIVAGWPYGLEYQSRAYMICVASVNALFWIALIILAVLGRRRKSFAINVAFHTLMFVWLAWYALPYAGESI